MALKTADTALNTYLSKIQADLKAGIATEHSYRPYLKDLVEGVFPGVVATNEPKREAVGAPDYIVTKGSAPLGYIEAKNLDQNLAKIENDPQLKRYREGLGNLILTDYLEFRWYLGGELRLTVRLATVNGKQLIPVPDGPANVADLLDHFINAQAPTISRPKELARRMASMARFIRDATTEALKAEGARGSLHDQLESFRAVLLPGLTAEQFADMYAQTICYGLFAARFNTPGKKFNRYTAANSIAKTNPFLRSTFHLLTGPDLDDRIDWAVDDVAELLGRTDVDSILKDFGKHTRQEDPVVHFYETFLAEYDPKMRESRGVYYTPEPVVSYIVRSVDYLLKTAFGLPEGLADSSKIKLKTTGESPAEIHKVQILDPATGTGTFLYSVINLIYEQAFKGNKGMWSGYVSEHLLPRLFGFEFLMAPYTIAHLKLALQLAETGYDFQSNERLNIFLTNTLEEGHKKGASLFAGQLKDEAGHADLVKHEYPIMVVLGNPPYSGHSANNSPWIYDLLRGKNDKTTGSYFEVDGQPLGEKNPKWLNDDYVKFIKFAQWRIQSTGYGILAYISNHGYLDNPTFRGMRQSLINTFDDIYVLDLHGNAKKKERSPNGSPDENVFDIQQGVAIGIFVKRAGGGKSPAIVHHAHLFGLREIYEKTGNAQKLVGGKYHWLWDNDVSTTEWKTLNLNSSNYFFTPQIEDLKAEYELGWNITEILPLNSLGIATARDSFTVHWSEKEVWETITDFINLTSEIARQKYKLGEDAHDWQVNLAQKDLRSSPLDSTKIQKLTYRPFDTRFTYYTGITRGFLCRPRPEVMGHLGNKNNLALCFIRRSREQIVSNFFVANHIVDKTVLSSADNANVAPLYLYPDTSKKTLFDLDEQWSGPGGRRPNLSTEFIEALKEKLGLEFTPDGKGDLQSNFGPEDVFHYMYAVFHSPTYRSRYAEFLKIDFPRLPLTANLELFRALGGLGEKLVGLHLLEGQPLPKIASFPQAGTNKVENVRYTEPGQGGENQPGRVWINNQQYFEGINPELWDFHIGGYQVLQKWLKDRKGRTLSYDDLTHYMKVVSSLAETGRLMAGIDETIEEHGGWPLS